MVERADPTSVMGRRVVAVLIDAGIVLGPPVALVTSSLEYIEEDDLDRLGVDGADFCERHLDSTGTNEVCIESPDGRVYYGDPGVAPFITLWTTAVVMYVLLQGLTGWTIGKLLAGIRVVREDGTRPGLLKALVRWVFWIVDGLPYVLPGVVAFITGLTTVGHRRVGDMVAKTFVVRASAAGQPVAVPAPSLAAPMTGQPIPPPPSAVPGPQWDEARGTYIQWDPEAMAWMQWDDATKAWNRVPGQPAPLPPPPPTPPPPPPPPA
jgi:hypothetical protein